MSIYAIIVAGGSSVRFGGETPKQFRLVCGKPLLAWTLSRFEAAASVERVVVVAPESYVSFVAADIIDANGFLKVEKVVCGGGSRRESALHGLEALPGSAQLVAIHDGARPLVRSSDIDRVVKAGESHGAAMLAAAATDTVHRAEGLYAVGTHDRRQVYLAQTPQVFEYKLILSVHRAAAEGRLDAGVTDDASMVQAVGRRVAIVEPSAPNPKVTAASDMIQIEAALRRELDE